MTFKEKKQYYIDKFKAALALMPEDEKKYETIRVQVALRLVLAEKEHRENISAYEKQTEPIRKTKLVNRLPNSALELGIAKHQARYYGLKVD